jgi:hypothetical protein
MILSSREPKKLLMVITPFGSFGPKGKLPERRVVGEVQKCWLDACSHVSTYTHENNAKPTSRNPIDAGFTAISEMV